MGDPAGGGRAEFEGPGMILVGIGGNLTSERFVAPRDTCAAALEVLAADGTVQVAARSSWYLSEPVPASDQPWYTNAVARLETRLDAAALLARLHAVEEEFGRRRSVPNAARTLDLDLLDYDGAVSAPGAWPALPHPRMHQRAFVLLPLAELAADWRHPATGTDIGSLIAALPPGQKIVRVAD